MLLYAVSMSIHFSLYWFSLYWFSLYYYNPIRQSNPTKSSTIVVQLNNDRATLYNVIWNDNNCSVLDENNIDSINIHNDTI